MFNPTSGSFWEKVREQVEIEVKYSGFLERQRNQVKKLKELEGLKIPQDFDYGKVSIELIGSSNTEDSLNIQAWLVRE